jgi:hypothetical protein
MWGDAMKVIQQWLPDTDFSVPDPTAIQGRLVTVPSVYGYSPSEAADILRRAGLNPVVGPQVNSSSSYGTVAFLSPGSGTQIATGSTVTMYISNGTPEPPSGGGGGGGGGGNDKPGHGRGRGHR